MADLHQNEQKPTAPERNRTYVLPAHLRWPPPQIDPRLSQTCDSLPDGTGVESCRGEVRQGSEDRQVHDRYSVSTQATPDICEKRVRDFSRVSYFTGSEAHLLHRVCFDDDGISIEDRPVSSLDVFRVRRTLWPSPLAMSLWSFTGALVRQNAAAISKAVGFETQDQPNATVQQTFEQVQKQLQQSQVKPDSKSPNSLPRTQSQVPDGSSSASASSSTPRATPGTPNVNQALPPSPNTSDRRQKSAREIYAVKMAQEHTSGPWQAFKQKLSQTWRPLHDYPPRGSVSVSGIVELDMPRARVTVEAFAWWDPKTEKFDGRSFYIRWRSIRPKVQNPLR